MFQISQLPPVRFLQSATAGAAVTAAAGWPAAALAQIAEPAEDLSLAPADSADGPPLPWAPEPDPAAVPATVPPPVSAPALPPLPIVPPPPIAPLSPAEDTKLLAAASGFPAAELLHSQAIDCGHPHLLQLRVRRLTGRPEYYHGSATGCRSSYVSMCQ